MKKLMCKEYPDSEFLPDEDGNCSLCGGHCNDEGKEDERIKYFTLDNGKSYEGKLNFAREAFKDYREGMRGVKNHPSFEDWCDTNLSRIVFNVRYFNEKGGEINDIDQTQIDEKDEVLAWDLFREFGLIKIEGDRLEFEAVREGEETKED